MLPDSLRDTGRTMSEESTTPVLVELARRRVGAVDRGDIEAMTSFFAPDAAWDCSWRAFLRVISASPVTIDAPSFGV
jgi:hypothetical protein